MTWDARTLGDWVGQVDGAAAVVNLVGRTVDCVKSPDHCDEILRSRVEATKLLGEAIRQAETPPPVWVQMSTAHIYGDPPEAICDENSAFGYGLAPFVGRACGRRRSKRQCFLRPARWSYAPVSYSVAMVVRCHGLFHLLAGVWAEKLAMDARVSVGSTNKI